MFAMTVFPSSSIFATRIVALLKEYETHTVCCGGFAHPTDAFVGQAAFPFAYKHIEKCTNPDVCWKYLQSESEKYLITGVQLFSDNSYIPRRASLYLLTHCTSQFSLSRKYGAVFIFSKETPSRCTFLCASTL